MLLIVDLITDFDFIMGKKFEPNDSNGEYKFSLITWFRTVKT